MLELRLGSCTSRTWLLLLGNSLLGSNTLWVHAALFLPANPHSTRHRQSITVWHSRGELVMGSFTMPCPPSIHGRWAICMALNSRVAWTGTDLVWGLGSCTSSTQLLLLGNFLLGCNTLWVHAALLRLANPHSARHRLSRTVWYSQGVRAMVRSNMPWPPSLNGSLVKCTLALNSTVHVQVACTGTHLVLRMGSCTSSTWPLLLGN